MAIARARSQRRQTTKPPAGPRSDPPSTGVSGGFPLRSQVPLFSRGAASRLGRDVCHWPVVARARTSAWPHCMASRRLSGRVAWGHVQVAPGLPAPLHATLVFFSFKVEVGCVFSRSCLRAIRPRQLSLCDSFRGYVRRKDGHYRSESPIVLMCAVSLGIKSFFRETRDPVSITCGPALQTHSTHQQDDIKRPGEMRVEIALSAPIVPGLARSIRRTWRARAEPRRRRGGAATT